MKSYEELLEENKQLKIKLSNAYNEIAVWKGNAKFLTDKYKGENNEPR